ncbi:MAG: multiheme c-type cytochrome, partial [Nannocystaceae bacterium]
MALLLSCASCGRSTPQGKSGPDASPPQTEPISKAPAKKAVVARQVVDLFILGRALGTIAPCGCTTDPLGGVQYALGFIHKQGFPENYLVIEPGSLLFPEPGSAEAPTDEAGWAQAKLRADVLGARLQALGDRLVSGVGPTDLASPAGVAALETYALPRVLANAPSAHEKGLVARHRKVQVGGVTAGVTAVVDPALPGLEALGPFADPAAALERELSSIKDDGADLSIAVVHGGRALAESIVDRVPGFDIVVVGVPHGMQRSREGMPVARRKGTWIVEPGEKLQTLTHLRLAMHPDAIGELPPASEWEQIPSRASQERELARLDSRLSALKADPEADPTFVARLEHDRETMAAALARPNPPEKDVAATFEQVKVTCRLPADDDAKQALARHDEAVSAQNQARFAGVKPPPPAKGEAGYVGDEECGNCHDAAKSFWDSTRHAQAYDTLVAANKEFDLSCVGCHVTGFNKPGGSHVVENAGLRDIQCEQCHGPGSLHVEEPEKAGKPHAITREVPEQVCG